MKKFTTYAAICTIMVTFCLIGCATMYGDLPPEQQKEIIYQDAYDIGQAVAKGETNADIQAMISDAWLTPDALIARIWPGILDDNNLSGVLLRISLRRFLASMGVSTDTALDLMDIDPVLYGIARDGYTDGLRSMMD